MFTGIIEATAKVLELTENGIQLERPKIFDDIKHGCSIAVLGVCLSVTSFTDTTMSFDVVRTTFQKTKLGSLKVGDRVNLERAMKADGRFEGHIVTGHVEGVGRVSALSPNPSPVPGEGDEGIQHVWKGVSGLKYAPSTVVENARSMRKKPTKAEDVLWQMLRGKKMSGYYFRRQRPIGSCIVDFYCEDLKLAIEVDGDVHDDNDQKAYDEWREEHLRLKGIHFLRFKNQEVLSDVTEVIASIKKYCSVPLTPEGGGVRGGGMNNERVSHNPQLWGEGTKDEGAVHQASDTLLTISIPQSLLPYIVHHGSITIDGVALTVAGLSDDSVTVALIPLTLEETTLGHLRKNDSVNIETDIVGKYILQAHGHG